MTRVMRVDMAVDSMMADPIPGLTFHEPIDPDTQATVTDFLDFTELYPSDLIRSLTLIGKLDAAYNDATAQVHDLTKTYGQLPKLPEETRPDPQDVRRDISKAMEQALASREAAFAEAARLMEVTERHAHRLATIKQKLQELPQPPSRDPTPTSTTPQLARSRKHELDKRHRANGHAGHVEQSALRAQQHKRLLVPGEVLPPGEEVIYSAFQSDSEDEVVSRAVTPLENGVDESPEQPLQIIRIRPPKAPPALPKIKIPKLPKPVVEKPPGGRIAIAGISTSNALALLTPPPFDARPGSRHQPWLKLTEYEMAVLRKQMKKNAVWVPSETMVRRELARTGRGLDAMAKAKEEADANGEEFLDEDPLDTTKDTPGPGELNLDRPVTGLSDTVNRGMLLNEAKKQKKEKEKETQALDEVNKRMMQSSEVFQNLFSKLPSPVQTKEPSKSLRKRKRDSDKELTPVSLKSFSPSVQEVQVNPPKRLRLTSSAITDEGPGKVPEGRGKASSRESSPVKTDTNKRTEKVPLRVEGPSSSPRSNTSRARATTPPTGSATFAQHKRHQAVQPTAAQTRSRRTSTTRKTTSPVPPIQVTKVEPVEADEPAEASSTRLEVPDTRRQSRSSAAARSIKAASAEPVVVKQSTRESRQLRRSSVVDAPATVAELAQPIIAGNTRVTRAGRRPAPGFVTADEHGKSKVSVGGRRSAPKKRGPKKGDQKENDEPTGEEAEPLEEIDPDEPRYCICNDVSYGVMIACQNDQCEKEWFHLACVNRTKVPPSRQKWWCPECRALFDIDEYGKPLAEPDSGRTGGRVSRAGNNYSLSVSERVKRGRRVSDDNNIAS